MSDDERIGKLVPLFAKRLRPKKGEVLVSWEKVKNMLNDGTLNALRGFYLRVEETTDAKDRTPQLSSMMSEYREIILALTNYAKEGEVLPDEKIKLRPGIIRKTLLDFTNYFSDKKAPHPEFHEIIKKVIETLAPETATIPRFPSDYVTAKNLLRLKEMGLIAKLEEFDAGVIASEGGRRSNMRWFGELVKVFKSITDNYPTDKASIVI